ncbi:hypothetical protein BDK51DRAFT_47406 [Blyttiomyces helicus]|uniref:Uncharacterized protein n=1 Tax=Blyttiomyces helicus TaxID=388810 RepID=A0A4P9VXZ1_9FUNG|nr:hypothetical protein BDK51DRAFT_47406 [Blyttiomyces helicus]|eukprot:RKO84631.1 hypothetical protein BDK51DRAFT_47406 [Blyttiomyces helicus]
MFCADYEDQVGEAGVGGAGAVSVAGRERRVGVDLFDRYLTHTRTTPPSIPTTTATHLQASIHTTPDELTTLISHGLLTLHEGDALRYAVRHAGPFWAAVGKGRRELLRILNRRSGDGGVLEQEVGDGDDNPLYEWFFHAGTGAASASGLPSLPMVHHPRSPGLWGPRKHLISCSSSHTRVQMPIGPFIRKVSSSPKGSPPITAWSSAGGEPATYTSPPSPSPSPGVRVAGGTKKKEMGAGLKKFLSGPKKRK